MLGTAKATLVLANITDMHAAMGRTSDCKQQLQLAAGTESTALASAQAHASSDKVSVLHT